MTLLVILSSQFSVSQHLPFRRYNTENGLSNSTVLNFYQDRNGYIWFGTDNGLNKFDGKDFLTYHTQNGIPENNVIGITEDVKGNFWAGVRYKGFARYTGSGFESYKINSTQYPSQEMFDIFGESFVSFSNYIMFITKNNLCSKIYLYYNGKPLYVNHFLQISDTSVLVTSKDGLYFINPFDSAQINKIEFGKVPGKNISYLGRFKDGNILISSGNKIFRISISGIQCEILQEMTIADVNSDIKIFYPDYYGDIWFTTTKGGLYCNKNNKILNIGEYSGLKNCTINFIKEDNEKNLWVGTLGKGAFCFYNRYIYNYGEESGLSNLFITSLDKINENQIIAGTGDGLNFITEDRIDFIKPASVTNACYIKSVKPFGKNRFIVAGPFGKENELQAIKREGIQYYLINKSFTLPVNDNDIISGNWANQLIKNRVYDLKLSLSDVVCLLGDSIKNVRINKIFMDSQRNIWAGSTEGIFRFNQELQKSFIAGNILTSGNISDIKEDKIGNIWIASDRGVSHYDGREWNLFETKYGSLNYATSIEFDKKGRLWVGTSNGLYFYNLDVIGNIIDEKYFTGNYGLLSREINTLYYDSLPNFMWVGTSAGLSRININESDSLSKQKTSLCVQDVFAGDSVYKIRNDDYLILDYGNNDFKLHLDVFCYRNPADVVIRYRNEEDGKWIYTNVPEIQFSSMPPGDYNILLSAKASDTDWSEPATFKFEIKTPYYKSKIFYSSIGIVFIALIILIVRARFRKTLLRQAEKAYIIHQVSALKHQALTAMLNPHFIFNCMNSIQSLVNSGESQRVINDYISAFSKLIRMNLDLAQDTMVLISEEIKRIELYFKLEKLRFGRKLNYEIKIDDKINIEETLVPNMILQPYVENSIWHGLNEESESGLIIIDITLQSIPYKNENLDSIIIRITDNGAGLENAFKNNNDHTPRGMKIIKERIELLVNDYPGYDFVNINDRTDGISGVLVEIKLLPGLFKIR